MNKIHESQELPAQPGGSACENVVFQSCEFHLQCLLLLLKVNRDCLSIQSRFGWNMQAFLPSFLNGNALEQSLQG